MSKKTISLLIALLTLISSSFFVPQIKQVSQKKARIKPPKEVSVSTNTGKVMRVIDGDTIELETKEKVRYIGIDTPELRDPRKPVQCFAKESFEINKNLVEGKIVKLEKDVSKTDKYGRLLRYVYLPQQEKETTSSGFMINDYLVRQGYAHAVSFPPDVKYQDQFLNAQSEARENNRGLWSSCR